MKKQTTTTDVKMWSRGLFFCAVFLTGATISSAYTSPGTPQGYINDFAEVLSAPVQATLEASLAGYERETSNQITVVTVGTIGDEYIENYAVKLFEEWKVGTHTRDNGVLVLLSVQDKKVRIEVGYGLEGAIPDSLADRIIRNEMVPKLKTSDYDGAVSFAVAAISKAAQGEYTQTRAAPASADWIGALLFFGMFGLQWFAAILGRTKDWWLGGVLGFAAGSGVALVDPFQFSLLAYALGIAGLTAFGFFFDYIVSSVYQHSVRYGYDAPWWSGGSSGFGGGSGGFGGFGGGSSGGGGASGSW